MELDPGAAHGWAQCADEFACHPSQRVPGGHRHGLQQLSPGDRPGPRGRYRRQDYLKSTVRLGAGLDAQGLLSEEAAQRGLDTLQGFAQRLQGFHSTQIRAVATQTPREARNRNAFLARAEAVLGHPVEVNSG